MEENQIQTELEASNFQIDEPISVDNSENEKIEVTDETKYLEEAMKLTNFDDLLNEAYFTLYDSSDKDLAKYQYTYIGQNGAYKAKNTLTKNSDNLLKDISGYASYLEYYVFDAIVYSNNTELVGDASYSVTFYDTALAEEIKEYVQDRLTGTDESFASSVQSAAETYGSKLAREAEVKEALENWEFQSK